jgi:cytochrome b pre-mRNA-processing protein 3
MLSRLFRGSSNRRVIDRIHGEIVAAARNQLLFTDYGIEDTLEGRFEAVVLLSAVVVHKLQALPDPGPEVAQDVADALFRHFDIALREMGVGDTTVPKRMKTIAEAYLGRAKAYQDACAKHDCAKDRLALAAALSRNVYAGKNDGVRLARYVGALSDRLDTLALDDFLNGPIPFPKPGDIG